MAQPHNAGDIMQVGDLVTVWNLANETGARQYTVLEIVDDEWLNVTCPEVSGYFTVRIENVLEVINGSR